jgi:hypothetical protein
MLRATYIAKDRIKKKAPINTFPALAISNCASNENDEDGLQRKIALLPEAHKI